MAYGFVPIWRAMGYASLCRGLAGLVGWVGLVSSGEAIAGRTFLCALCGSFGVNGTIGLLKELEQNAEQRSSR